MVNLLPKNAKGTVCGVKEKMVYLVSSMFSLKQRCDEQLVYPLGCGGYRLGTGKASQG